MISSMGVFSTKRSRTGCCAVMRAIKSAVATRSGSNVRVYAVSVAQYDRCVGVGDVFCAFEIDDEAALCCDAGAKVFEGARQIVSGPVR